MLPQIIRAGLVGDRAYKIVQAHVEELTASQPDNSVGFVLTDPPYNVSRPNNFHTMGRTGIDFEWDHDFDQLFWLPEMVRVARPGCNIVIFNDWKNLGTIAKALEGLGCEVKRMIEWQKTNPMPRNRRRLTVQGSEYAVWAVKPRTKAKGDWVFNFTPTLQTQFHRGIFYAGIERSKTHPTRKPVKLFRELIRLFSNSTDLVFDPFAGEGTTLLASLEEGRSSVVGDLHLSYLETTNERFNKLLIKKGLTYEPAVQ